MKYNLDPILGGIKHDTNKPRMELIPAEALVPIAEVFGYGARKYEPFQWRRGPGMDYLRLYGAVQRHLTAWHAGEDKDPESGLGHLGHAAADLLMLLSHIAKGQGVDDRPEAVLARHRAANEKATTAIKE